MNLKRNKMIVPFKVITGFTFICIILLAYFQVANETDEQSVTDRAGFLFFYIVLMVFVAI